MDDFDRLVREVEMHASRRNCPGDPLFIQVDTINKEKWRECIKGTPFNGWMFFVSTAWVVDRKGRVRCLKDSNRIYREMDPKPEFINELFETVEEMLTHEQAPVRSWGRWYHSRQQLNNV